MKKNICLYVIAFLAVACTNKEDGNYKFKNDKELLKSITEQLIIPEINAFAESCTVLQSKTERFIENATEENLNELQKQWLAVAKGYERCYTFNIGDVRIKRYNVWISSFPINNEGIENKIQKLDEITKSQVSGMASDLKGLFGVEYLLYGYQNQELVNQFTSNSNRRKLLKYVVEELVDDAKNQQNSWREFASVFIQNKSESGIDNSFNLLFNGINNIIHFTQETKIGKPSGFEKSPAVNKVKIQARFSRKTLELIKENITMTKKVFFGDGSFTSISDKITYVTKNEKLNDAIRAQYQEIETALQAIDSSLYESITSDIEDVKTLYKALKRLEVLFTADVQSTLSLIVTRTDGDGD